MPAEKLHPRPAQGAGPAGLGDIFGDSDNTALCTVHSGPYGEQLPVANMPVREIRRRYHDRFDIDPQSQAILDGREVGDDTILRAGQVLMFSRKAGEKG